MIYDCIIVGAGASGLFCSANMNGPVKGLVLEKTSSPGTKLLMSGSGQCNITHSGSIKDFVSCYGSNGNKVRSCLYKASNASLISFLENNGVAVTTREDGKVFPASMDAHEVLNMLIGLSKKNGFQIKCNEAVTGISATPNGWSVQTSTDTYNCHNLVISTGGCSYPATGSDGSFFKILKKDLNISITPLLPALSSIRVEDYPYADLSGISFENALAEFHSKEKKTIKNNGPLLFTHKDFSGPLILNMSKYARPGDRLKINYIYPTTQQEALELLKKAASGNNAQLSTLITQTFSLAKRFSQIIADSCGNSLKKAASLLTGEEFTIKSTTGFNRAMATAGGIDLSQINTKTMEFIHYPGLFAIGEVLDVDGITGGYNLQFAYSSAKAAALEIESKL